MAININMRVRVCKTCEKEYNERQSRAGFCSRDCYWQSMKGIERKARVNKICNGCKKQFSVLPHRMNARFCSRECNYVAAKLRYTPEVRNEMSRIKKKQYSNGLEPANKGKSGISGKEHPSWKGGMNKAGRYIEQLVGANTRKLQHRIVMEKLLGRKLKRREHVHHWNQDGTDNRQENLQLFRNGSAHLRLHWFAKRHNIQIETLKFDQSWLFDPV